MSEPISYDVCLILDSFFIYLILDMFENSDEDFSLFCCDYDDRLSLSSHSYVCLSIFLFFMYVRCVTQSVDTGLGLDNVQCFPRVLTLVTMKLSRVIHYSTQC